MGGSGRSARATRALCTQARAGGRANARQVSRRDRARRLMSGSQPRSWAPRPLDARALAQCASRTCAPRAPRGGLPRGASRGGWRARPTSSPAVFLARRARVLCACTLCCARPVRSSQLATWKRGCFHCRRFYSVNYYVRFRHMQSPPLSNYAGYDGTRCQQLHSTSVIVRRLSFLACMPIRAVRLQQLSTFFLRTLHTFHSSVPTLHSQPPILLLPKPPFPSTTLQKNITISFFFVYTVSYVPPTLSQAKVLTQPLT